MGGKNRRWNLLGVLGQIATEQANPVGPALDFLEQIGTGWSFGTEVND